MYSDSELKTLGTETSSGPNSRHHCSTLPATTSEECALYLAHDDAVERGQVSGTRDPGSKPARLEPATATTEPALAAEARPPNTAEGPRVKGQKG